VGLGRLEIRPLQQDQSLVASYQHDIMTQETRGGHMNHPFKVGEIYKNRIGAYEVVLSARFPG
jgi:hypothetical protein